MGSEWWGLSPLSWNRVRVNQVGESSMARSDLKDEKESYPTRRGLCTVAWHWLLTATRRRRLLHGEFKSDRDTALAAHRDSDLSSHPPALDYWRSSAIRVQVWELLGLNPARLTM